MAIIRTEHLGREVEGKRILDDINLEVAEGEVGCHYDVLSDALYQARPLSIRFQYMNGRPYFLRYQ